MRKLKNWVPSIVVMVIIFIVSSIPGNTIQENGWGEERYHIGAHFILFVFLCVSFFKGTKNIFMSILLTVLYAVIDELHQTFTPLRSVSIFDIYVDTLGAVIAGFFLWKLLPILPKKLKDLLFK